MSLRVIIGIDPGVNGAIAVVADGEIMGIADMPTLDRAGGGQVIDAHALHVKLSSLCANHPGAHLHAVIEPPSTRPGESPTNALKMGEGYGKLKGVLACHGIAYTEVRPQEWKKHYGLVKVGEYKPTKDDSRHRAMSLWPNFGIYFQRACDHDRAEAMLLAQWGLDTECWVPKAFSPKVRKPRAKPKAKMRAKVGLL